jgi:D-alanyl-D-alanine carboxypeptidase (penicillin-binding protein 5/6)
MGMVVQSGNDATVALAEHVAGSEGAFVELMNKEAARLGMANSHFMNTPGLPHTEHYTSARDIALLVRAIIKDFPDQYARYSVREFTYNNIKQPNRNRLLYQDPTVDGVKTGHTATAGYCLAASAKRGDLRLISVVFGTKLDRERFAASQVLLEYGFRNYESVKLHDGNVPLAELRIWKGTINRLPLGLSEALYATVPKGKAGGVQTVLKATDDIVRAPVAQGTPLGNVSVNLGETPLSETPLVALQEVPEAGFFGRLWDSILLFFYSLFH